MALFLLIFSILPAVLILLYIHSRKKYEQEPFSLLFKAFGLGMLSTVIIITAALLTGISVNAQSSILSAFTDAFFMAAIPEEFLKFIMLYSLVWNNKHFEERFDGIIYAVFVSMGFATLENILYVFSSGVGVAVIRAITAVPAHALFGVAMGYYFSYAKFLPELKNKYLFLSIIMPVLLHGVYDFLLLWQASIFEEHPIFSIFLLLLFIVFVIYLWHQGFKKIKKLSADFYFQGIPQNELHEYLANQNEAAVKAQTENLSIPLPPVSPTPVLPPASPTLRQGGTKQHLRNWQEITPRLFETEKEALLNQFPDSIIDCTNGIMTAVLAVNNRYQWLLQLTYAKNYRKIKDQLRVYIIEPDFDELIGISGDIPHVKSDLSGNKFLSVDSENNISGANTIQNSIRWIELFEKWVDGEIEINQFRINL